MSTQGSSTRGLALKTLQKEFANDTVLAKDLGDCEGSDPVSFTKAPNADGAMLSSMSIGAPGSKP